MHDAYLTVQLLHRRSGLSANVAELSINTREASALYAFTQARSCGGCHSWMLSWIVALIALQAELRYL